jgi:hypothetical protein
MNIIDKAIAKLPPEYQREWEAINEGVRDPIDKISEWFPAHRRAVAVAWSDWAREQTDARVVIIAVAKWSPKLGVLLACVCAREAVKYVSASERRPYAAIETAEFWVLGRASGQSCKYAAAEARDAESAAYDYAAVYATKSAESAVSAASAAADSVADSVAAAAYDAASAAAHAAAAVSAKTWSIAYRAELRRLCGVISDDLIEGRTGQYMLFHSDY